MKFKYSVLFTKGFIPHLLSVEVILIDFSNNFYVYSKEEPRVGPKLLSLSGTNVRVIDVKLIHTLFRKIQDIKNEVKTDILH